MNIESSLYSWCENVAALAVDMLVDHGLLKKEDFERAVELVAEEILVRLTIGDYPQGEQDKQEPPKQN